MRSLFTFALPLLLAVAIQAMDKARGDEPERRRAAVSVEDDAEIERFIRFLGQEAAHESAERGRAELQRPPRKKPNPFEPGDPRAPDVAHAKPNSFQRDRRNQSGVASSFPFPPARSRAMAPPKVDDFIPPPTVRQEAPTPSRGASKIPREEELRVWENADRKIAQASSQLAEQYRMASPATRSVLREELMEIVQQHFEVRQRLRQLEAQDMAERAKRLAEAVERRAAKRERLIDQRISDLLGERVDF